MEFFCELQSTLEGFPNITCDIMGISSFKIILSPLVIGAVLINVQ